MKNEYSLTELVKNVLSLIYTKIFFKNARLIRRPFYLRGKQYLKYEGGLTTGYNCRFEMFVLNNEKTNQPKIVLGENCKIGDNVHIAAAEKVSIGKNCLIASKVYISDISHGNYSNNNIPVSTPYSRPDERELIASPISIGENVWIGENVCILPGITIGDGVIIGANSVVNKSVPKNCIVAGVPAKVVKIFNEDEKKWVKVR